MKISCPDCKASYDADLPDLPKEGTQVNCAKCQKSFLVMPESSEEIDSELDSMLDDLIDSDMTPNTEIADDNPAEPETADDDTAEPELDSMLDELIDSDMTPNTR